MGMHKRLSPEEKAARGMFLCLGELATVTGIGQNRMRAIAKEPGFPMYQKKVTLVDFQSWYRRQIGVVVEISTYPQSGEHHQSPVAGMSDEQSPTHDSPRVARLSPKRRTAQV